jgi:hypothetical protein
MIVTLDAKRRLTVPAKLPGTSGKARSGADSIQSAPAVTAGRPARSIHGRKDPSLDG